MASGILPSRSEGLFPALAITNSYIRLLRIELASGSRLDSECLQCTSRAFRFPDAVPPYEALSWTWGDPKQTDVLVLNGFQHRVSSNLTGFLKRYRHQRVQRYLWIDALCINQNDKQEKQEQIQIMHRIYAASTKFTIWLGEKPEEIDLHPMLAHYMRTGLTKSETTPQRYWADIETRLDFLCASWWDRIWIVQEVAFGIPGKQPKDVQVMLGHVSECWSKLMKGFDAFFNRNMEHYTLARRYLTLREVPRHIRWRVSPNLIQLLVENRNRQCMDQRDKVFALLNLAESKLSTGVILSPDYNLSLTEICRTVARAEMIRSQSLHILRHCGRPGPEMNCSWAPDWSQPIKEYMFQSESLQEFCAGTKEGRPPRSMHEQEHKLIVRTIFREQILATTSPLIPRVQTLTADHGPRYLCLRRARVPNPDQFISVRECEHLVPDGRLSWSSLFTTSIELPIIYSFSAEPFDDSCQCRVSELTQLKVGFCVWISCCSRSLSRPLHILS